MKKWDNLYFQNRFWLTKELLRETGKEGKRGIRVYSPWDMATNKQAEKTQTWQTGYFLTIKNDNLIGLDLAK